MSEAIRMLRKMDLWEGGGVSGTRIPESMAFLDSASM